MIAFLPPLLPPNRSLRNLVLRVEEAKNYSDRGQLLSVPRHLYRGDRRWVPPLVAQRRCALRHERNPLLSGVELGVFVGTAQNLGFGDEPVGSIVAWREGVEDEYERGAFGSWGLFESVNVEALPERLFYEAETWLFKEAGGLGGIRGPLSLEPLVSPGLLTDGFDQDPAAFLPYNPPYYPEMIEAQGYAPWLTWRAYLIETGSHTAERQPDERVRWDDIFTAYSAHEKPPLDRPSLVPGLMGWLGSLVSERSTFGAWDWRWALARAARYAICQPPNPEREAQVAVFGIPDLAQALRRVNGRLFPFRWLAFALALRRTRRLRVFPAAVPRGWAVEELAELYDELMLRAAYAGYRQMLVAPICEDDERSVAALERLHARLIQQFTIYEKRF